MTLSQSQVNRALLDEPKTTNLEWQPVATIKI